MFSRGFVLMDLCFFTYISMLKSQCIPDAMKMCMGALNKSGLI